MLDFLGAAIAISLAIIALNSSIRFLLPFFRRVEFTPLRIALTYVVIVFLIKEVQGIRETLVQGARFLIPALFAAVIADCTTCVISRQLNIANGCGKGYVLFDMSCPNLIFAFAMIISPIPAFILMDLKHISYILFVYIFSLVIFTIVDILFKYASSVDMVNKE